MEFNEKLQELRRSRGLTQEELAEALYVSRTAISKWESGRGYPNIDSLKAIAKFFGVTIDQLLSSDEVLTIAEEDNRRIEGRLRDIVFGLIDCGTALLLFLPLFRMGTEGTVRAVSVFEAGVALYMKDAYLVFIFAAILCGITTLALQGCGNVTWIKLKNRLSFGLNALGMLVFILSLQPYAAAMLFVFMVIKTLMLIKWQ